MGWLRNLIVKKGNDTYTYTDTFNNWEYNKSGTTHTLTGLTFNNWTFFTVSGSNTGAYCKGGSITILESKGTVDNYPLYICKKGNIKYYTPFVLSSCVPSYSSPTGELSGDFNNLYLTLSCPNKVFYAKYGNIDIFINKSMKMAFNNIQDVNVSDKWNGSLWNIFTKASAIRELGPTLLYEYQTVNASSSRSYTFPSWRGFKTLANGNFNSLKRIACININTILLPSGTDYNINFYTNYSCTSSNTAHWTTSIDTSGLNYYTQSPVSYSIDGIYHTISIPNTAAQTKGINYVGYQNETQQNSKIQFYGVDLTYNKTNNDTMLVHTHPRCGLYTSVEDIYFRGENVGWQEFYAQYWTLTISRDSYVLADYNNSLGDGYEKIGGRSVWHISSPATQYTGVQKGVSYTLFGPTGSSLTTYSVPSSAMGGGFYFQLGTYTSGSTNKTGIWLRGRSTSGSDSSFGLVYETSLSSFRVGYHESEDEFSWDSITTNFSWINNNFNSSSQMIYYKQGRSLMANNSSSTKLVTTVFTDNSFPNGTYYVTFSYNGYCEYGSQHDNCGNARFIQTYRLSVNSNGITLSPININT